jgi:hypothetical protein
MRLFVASEYSKPQKELLITPDALPGSPAFHPFHLEYNATRASRQKKSVASAKTVSTCSIRLMWESEQRRVAKL